MSRRNILLLSLLGIVIIAAGVYLLVFGGEDEDDTSDETYAIGVVNLGPVLDPVFDGFKSRLAELGYVEGENVTYIYDGPVNDISLIEAEVQQMIDADVDLILALSTPVAQVAKELTADNQIPIVFAPITDPVGAGLVESMANPTGNLTGTTHGPQIGLRFEWLTRLDPTIDRIWIPYNSDDAAPRRSIQIIDETAETLGVEYVAVETRNLDELNEAIENIPEDIDAIFLPADTLVVSNAVPFIELALERDLPLSVPSALLVSEGALVSYSFNFFECGEQAGRLGTQILEGTAPNDLPVEVNEFFLTLNLETADAIGLEISNDILRQADEIFRE